jgi:hypothetical protein
VRRARSSTHGSHFVSISRQERTNFGASSPPWIDDLVRDLTASHPPLRAFHKVGPIDLALKARSSHGVGLLDEKFKLLFELGEARADALCHPHLLRHCLFGGLAIPLGQVFSGCLKEALASEGH